MKEMQQTPQKYTGSLRDYYLTITCQQTGKPRTKWINSQKHANFKAEYEQKI